MANLKQQILSHIKEKPNKRFWIKDLLHLGDRDTIKKAMLELYEEGLVYAKPHPYMRGPEKTNDFVPWIQDL